MSPKIECRPNSGVLSDGDVFQWYRTRNQNYASAFRILPNIAINKYIISGNQSQYLVIKNVNSSDDGFYFCQSNRNVVPPWNGACVLASSK